MTWLKTLVSRRPALLIWPVAFLIYVNPRHATPLMWWNAVVLFAVPLAFLATAAARFPVLRVLLPWGARQPRPRTLTDVPDGDRRLARSIRRTWPALCVRLRGDGMIYVDSEPETAHGWDSRHIPVIREICGDPVGLLVRVVPQTGQDPDKMASAARLMAQPWSAREVVGTVVPGGLVEYRVHLRDSTEGVRRAALPDVSAWEDPE